MDLARREGGRILCGGGPAEVSGRCRHGYFVQPTIIEGLDEHCRVNQEEIFGPVLAVTSYDRDEEAIAIANDSRYGLNGGIETADAAKGYAMALRIQAGSVALNGGTGKMSYAPIGGYKRSGIGREYGPDWLREYQQEKSIFYPIGR